MSGPSDEAKEQVDPWAVENQRRKVVSQAALVTRVNVSHCANFLDRSIKCQQKVVRGTLF